MKRYKSLIHLSHDHHSGLKLAMAVSSNSPHDFNLQMNPADKAAIVLSAWDKELSPHFKNEEEVLFPAVSGINEKLDEVIEELLIEHKEIERIVNSLKNELNSVSLLDRFSFILTEHIRKEERILFQQIQNCFSEEELEILLN